MNFKKLLLKICGPKPQPLQQNEPLYFRSKNPDASEKIALIDHSFHKKTVSSAFFTDLLTLHYHVEIFWDESWRKGPSVNLKKLKDKNFSCVIFWQVFHFYDANVIKKLGIPKCIIVPMLDYEYFLPEKTLKKYHACNFICFSSTFHQKLAGLNLNSTCFRYFVNPWQLWARADSFETLKGFFWQRTNDITWCHIKALIGNTKFSEFHLHLATDPPGFLEIMPDAADIAKYNIVVSHWFDTKEEYLNILESANVFFAPRHYEGIGLSFIEAMAMGKVIVAPDTPTMNEYIQHNVNGILYNKDNIVPVDYTKAKEIAQNASEYCKQGYMKWEESKPNLLKMIEPNR